MWPAAEPDPFERDESLRTDPQAVLRLWEHPERQVLAVRRGAVSFDVDGSVDIAESILLGTCDGQPWFAVRKPDPGAHDVRELAGEVDHVRRSAALTAVALDNWHHTHQRCSRCGEGTDVERAGWMRRCPADGSEHYPRTDPAVIVLVVDDEDRALLGRRSVWPQGWFSTLAGFVEPGETLEQAVVREVAEEAGVVLDVAEAQYRGSQPWPFPASIMLAFTARARVQETVPDGDEIAETGWFSRAQFDAAGEAGQLRVPPPISVAYKLIRDWHGQSIPHTWSR